MAYGSPILIPDVEIMVYLGILDTRKFLGSQKILYRYLVAKMTLMQKIPLFLS